MDQIFELGGTIGYGDSYLAIIFRRFKKLRPQAILHEAAGAVPAQSCRSTGHF